MISLYLLLLVTQSFALEYTIPSNFGGETDFSDRGWRELIWQLSPNVKIGQPPLTEINIGVEPTCAREYLRCSTSYFGKKITLIQPDSAQLWVKWHQDATRFTCNAPEGCIVTSATSVADLSSQSDGWNIIASINAKSKIVGDIPTVTGNERALLSCRYSEEQITPKTMTSKKTLTSRCFQGHRCYLQTGTLMMNISGKCNSQPVIVCDRAYLPCEEFRNSLGSLCSQWAEFTLKYCISGVFKPKIDDCVLTVAVTGDNGIPMSFQVFQQKPTSGKISFDKREYFEPENPFGMLPDGSSGAWMAWRP